MPIKHFEYTNFMAMIQYSYMINNTTNFNICMALPPPLPEEADGVEEFR